MNRTATRMADGRELIYFDEVPAPRRGLPDRRELPPVESLSHLRYDPARWPVEVILAPNRQVPDLPSLSDVERDAFVVLHLDVLRRLNGLHDTPTPYISAWRRPRSGTTATWPTSTCIWSALGGPRGG